MPSTIDIDRRDETRADLAREAEANASAAGLSYMHGLKIGRAVEIALASLEADLIALDAGEKLEVAEAVQEACWGALEDDLNGAAIDLDQFERGLCNASNRYAEAHALWVRADA